MTATQTALPGGVRARGRARCWVIFMGGMAAGSTLWGQVASGFGIPAALTLAATGAVIGIAVTWRFRIGRHDIADLAPSLHWPTPMGAATLEHDRGPVMVTVEYRIDPMRMSEFAAVMQRVRTIRRRDGAYLWELFSDVEDPARQLESLVV